jgi:hypothetical protein
MLLSRSRSSSRCRCGGIGLARVHSGLTSTPPLRAPLVSSWAGVSALRATSGGAGDLESALATSRRVAAGASSFGRLRSGWTNSDAGAGGGAATGAGAAAGGGAAVGGGDAAAVFCFSSAGGGVGGTAVVCTAGGGVGGTAVVCAGGAAARDEDLSSAPETAAVSVPMTGKTQADIRPAKKPIAHPAVTSTTAATTRRACAYWWADCHENSMGAR